MAISVAALGARPTGSGRVALDPDTAKKLAAAGWAVLVESGAGAAAHFADADYKAAGATVVARASALKADVVAVVERPPAADLAKLRDGQVLLGMLDSRADAADLEKAAARGVSALCLERLPRQLSRAQTMDALSSQASVAGYRAVLTAAEAYGRYLPMMITAAGTAKPATVLVLGAGVAGLQAIGTARRLGAQVTGYDVRPAAREEVTSLGAQFLETSVGAAAGDGGYARELTKDEAKAQQAELADKIAGFDIVITTARVPGRKPPVLVTKATVAKMRAGSVIVDLAASPLGGNVDGSAPGQTVTTKNGVAIIGGDRLADGMAAGASAAYARNIAAMLSSIAADGEIVLDTDDEVVDALLIRAAAKGGAK